MTTATPHRFPRAARLLRRGDFDHVFQHRLGTARVRGLLCLVAPGRGDRPRIGFALSRKHLRLAVHRNRLKRLLREQFRQNPDLACVDLVILSRQEIRGSDPADWPELCRTLFVRIIARSVPPTG